MEHRVSIVIGLRNTRPSGPLFLLRGSRMDALSPRAHTAVLLVVPYCGAQRFPDVLQDVLLALTRQASAVHAHLLVVYTRSDAERAGRTRIQISSPSDRHVYVPVSFRWSLLAFRFLGCKDLSIATAGGPLVFCQLRNVIRFYLASLHVRMHVRMPPPKRKPCAVCRSDRVFIWLPTRHYILGQSSARNDGRDCPEYRKKYRDNTGVRYRYCCRLSKMPKKDNFISLGRC